MNDWPFKSLDRQFVAQIYDDYHEGMFILDSLGRIVYYNRMMAVMDGFAPMEEVSGKHFEDIYNLTEKNSVSLGCLATRAPIKRSVFYYTKQGVLVNAYCNSYPFFEDGRLAGALCFSLDFNLASTALEELTRTYMASPESAKKKPQSALEAPHTFADLIGRATSFISALDKAKEAAKYDLSIMLVGETGSGKELFAQAIHNHRLERDRRFMAVNCPAIPENLLESLLFGTTRGAFTGALDKAGLFEAAAGGTVFLDEINSMSMELQSKLLRVLQEKKVSRVGSTRDIVVDCQIISATSHNPYSEISAQRLRQDLFYRLGAVLIYIPPLRSRPDDIALLCDHFIRTRRPTLNKRVRGVTPEALEWLERQLWPGNVRELEHVVTSAMLFAKNSLWLKLEDFISLDHFRRPQSTPEAAFPPDSRADDTRPADSEQEFISFSLDLPPNHRELKAQNEAREKEWIIKILKRTEGHRAAAAAILGFSPQLLNSKLKKYDLAGPGRSNRQEKERVIEALEKTGGSKTQTAEMLGISRQLLHRKLKQYDLTQYQTTGKPAN